MMRMMTAFAMKMKRQDAPLRQLQTMTLRLPMTMVLASFLGVPTWILTTTTPSLRKMTDRVL